MPNVNESPPLTRDIVSNVNKWTTGTHDAQNTRILSKSLLHFTITHILNNLHQFLISSFSVFALTHTHTAGKQTNMSM